MKVLLINGSPRAKGCTYTALSIVEESLKQAGIETEIFQIGVKPVRGCIECKVCWETGRCVFQDDVLAQLYPKLEEADGFVFGSPTYFASANGSMVSLMDRLFYTAKELWLKPAACVVSARRGGTTAALDVLLKYPANRNMPIVSSQYWNMVHGNEPEEVLEDLEGIQTMRTLGKNMAWMLKCIEAGKNAGIEKPEIEEKIKTNYIRS
ncbi:MAG: flavodoxin family protein [Eubacteriales bacterium]|nr:flavodoxin family protein [Eubacteriales bacterium]